MEKEYFVYIVQCSDGSFYTGITNNYRRRLYEHNSGHEYKSYTFTRRPVKLVYVAVFNDVYEAISWEKRVKRWSRRKKEALIRNDWGMLSGLSLNFINRSIRKVIQEINLGVNKLCHAEHGRSTT